jgi:hypothetical protein
MPGARRLAGHPAVRIPQAGRHHSAPYSEPRSQPTAAWLQDAWTATASRGPTRERQARVPGLPRGRAHTARTASAPVQRHHGRSHQQSRSPASGGPMDFMCDSTTDGHRCRIVTLIDVFTRRAPASSSSGASAVPGWCVFLDEVASAVLRTRAGLPGHRGMARRLQQPPSPQLACGAHASRVRKATSDIPGGIEKGGTSSNLSPL